MINSAIVKTPLGPMTVAVDGGALTGLWFIGQKYYPMNTSAWVANADDPVFKMLQSWLNEYFTGSRSAPAFDIHPTGTPFQLDVWHMLREIPYGEVTTYGEIAKKLAKMMGLSSMSAQAVGGAVGHNPISILIPCHRVVGSGGKLTGYAGGLDRKRALLLLERGE